MRCGSEEVSEEGEEAGRKVGMGKRDGEEEGWGRRGMRKEEEEEIKAGVHMFAPQLKDHCMFTLINRGHEARLHCASSFRDSLLGEELCEKFLLGGAQQGSEELDVERSRVVLHSQRRARHLRAP
eukprot:6179461-Pleurochrysis_carterae.AAC.6